MDSATTQQTINRDPRIYCQQGPQSLEPTRAGALDGTRFVFKDLFDVAGYITGAGNPKWLQSHPPAEHTSPLITALLAQGASCVGRVQTDELAYSLNGQNMHYGTPVNPAAPDCLPGGSSSGSAVAVARGEADFAIGTDTGGSVRVPASYCGLFGLRPTLGKLSLEHCFELAKSFDTAGIFTRDLSLMQQVLDTQSGSHARSAVPVQPVRALYLDSTLAELLSPERLARLHQWCMQADIQLESTDFLAQCQLAQSKPTLAELSLLFRTIQGYEIIQHHDTWLREYGDSLDPAIYRRVEWSREITEQQYHHAQSQQASFRQQLLAAISQSEGLWLVPTTPSGPPALTLAGEALAQYRTDLMGLTSIAGLSGLPQLHLPMQGLSEGPCGISLLGLPNSESELIATGVALCNGECQGEPR